MKINSEIFKLPTIQDAILKLLQSQDDLFERRRKNIIEAGEDEFKLREICRVDVNKEIRENLNQYLHVFELNKRCSGLVFDNVYPKNTILNGSDPTTELILYNALKFQMICNYKEFSKMSNKEAMNLLYLIVVKLLYNINNSVTYRNKDNGNISYNPYTTKKIHSLCDQVYNTVITYEDYNILCLNGKIVNKESYVNSFKDNKLIYNGCLKVSRFTKEELENYITNLTKTKGKNPNYDELTDYIDINIIKQHPDFNASVVKNLPNVNIIRYYVKKFNLENMIAVKKRNSSKNKNLN